MTIGTYKKRTRRGLSEVLGTVFVVLILITAFNVTLFAMREQDKVNQAMIEKQNLSLSNIKEHIAVADTRVINNKLNLTITNDGNSRATLKSLYVINETSKEQTRYDLNVSIDGKSNAKNIGQSNPSVVIKSDKQYTIKVVSAAGNTAITRIKPFSNIALPMELFILPPTVTTLENVTLLLSVTNNMTDSDILTPIVTPTLSKSLSCSTSPACQFSSDYITPTASTIPKGGSTLFKWVFQVTAPAGTTMTFNASLANAKQGNYVIEKGRVEIVQESLTANQVIVGAALQQKPEVYMFAAGPFGDSPNNGDKGFWGVVMANPTNHTMKVKMLAINLFTSEKSSNVKIFPSNCGVTGIVPNSNWDCPHDNILRWQNIDNPIVIKANASYTFLTKAETGSLPAGASEYAFMISLSVFTDFGQFSRQGYASSMHNSQASVANVYLTDTAVGATALLDNHIFGNMTVTGPILGKRIYIAVADFDTDINAPLTTISSGTTLIINVPRGFPNVNIPGVDGYPGPLPTGFGSASKTTYSDGSTQIRATTNAAIGDTPLTGKEAAVFYFDVDIPSSGYKKTYVMYSFIEGTSAPNTFPAYAFGTFAITVCPSSECG